MHKLQLFWDIWEHRDEIIYILFRFYYNYEGEQL